MGMHLIFLDVDGVLNNDYTLDRCGQYIGIDDKYVANLRKIVDSIEDCRIILSSTWRLGLTRRKEQLEGHVDYLNNKLAKQGLEIYDVTPDLGWYHKCRGEEIHRWLEEHRDLDIESWVVLDDECFPDFQEYGIWQHWVSTDYYSPNGGLNDDKVEEAIRVLKGGVPSDFR